MRRSWFDNAWFDLVAERLIDWQQQKNRKILVRRYVPIPFSRGHWALYVIQIKDWPNGIHPKNKEEGTQ